LLPVSFKKGWLDEASFDIVEKDLAGQVKNFRFYGAESIGDHVGLAARELLELVVPCRYVAYHQPNVTTRLNRGAEMGWRIGGTALVKRRRLVGELTRIPVRSCDGWRQEREQKKKYKQGGRKRGMNP
jgi:hypothetical protein